MKTINKIGSIILEGADQMGKSTFANELAKKLDYPILHYSKNTTDLSEFDYYTKFLSEDKPYIVDRNYVSELVYGPIFRKYSKIDVETKIKIENLYNSNNTMLVLINRRNYEWLDRLEEFNKEGNSEVINRFLEIFKELDIIHKILIDNTDPINYIDSIVEYHKAFNYKNI